MLVISYLIHQNPYIHKHIRIAYCLFISSSNLITIFITILFIDIILSFHSRHTGSKPVIKEKLPKLRFKHYLKKKFTASFPDMKTDTTDVSASRKRTTSFTDHERQSKRSLSTIYDDDDDELPDLTPPIVSASHSLLGKLLILR